MDKDAGESEIHGNDRDKIILEDMRKTKTDWIAVAIPILIFLLVMSIIEFMSNLEISQERYRDLADKVNIRDCAMATAIFDEKITKNRKITKEEASHIETELQKCEDERFMDDIAGEVEARKTEIKWHRVETPEG